MYLYYIKLDRFTSCKSALRHKFDYWIFVQHNTLKRCPSNNYFYLWNKKRKYLKKIRIFFSLLLLLCICIVRMFVEKGRFRRRCAFIIHVGPSAFPLSDRTATDVTAKAWKLRECGSSFILLCLPSYIRHNLRSPAFLLYRRNINM